MSHDIILLVDLYLYDLIFIIRCFKYLISYVNILLDKKIYKDPFIFHVIYFIFSVKITHKKILLVEIICLYRYPSRKSLTLVHK
jgi:hypothetical protein